MGSLESRLRAIIGAARRRPRGGRRDDDDDDDVGWLTSHRARIRVTSDWRPFGPPNRLRRYAFAFFTFRRGLLAVRRPSCRAIGTTRPEKPPISWKRTSRDCCGGGKRAAKNFFLRGRATTAVADVRYSRVSGWLAFDGRRRRAAHPGRLLSALRRATGRRFRRPVSRSRFPLRRRRSARRFLAARRPPLHRCDVDESKVVVASAATAPRHLFRLSGSAARDVATLTAFRASRMRRARPHRCFPVLVSRPPPCRAVHSKCRSGTVAVSPTGRT